MNKRTIEVTIGQQRMTLKTDQDPERVAQLAKLVNERLEQILPFGQAVSHQVLLLLAMTLADELMQAKEKETTLRQGVKARGQKILQSLEREFPLQAE
jgi:cell division protein ZapA (FtsZ GTPase activity inhibitor)